jgi:hypothetical protein
MQGCFGLFERGVPTRDIGNHSQGQVENSRHLGQRRSVALVELLVVVGHQPQRPERVAAADEQRFEKSLDDRRARAIEPLVTPAWTIHQDRFGFVETHAARTEIAGCRFPPEGRRRSGQRAPAENTGAIGLRLENADSRGTRVAKLPRKLSKTRQHVGRVLYRLLGELFQG